ncbi:polysaccharide deacetylase family protein [Hymenobacter sp. DH14]|uniref:Polysaccharide deacetylase family protein n=1 Tax=Hymenobacter cyanobacteriorum TaxID=2926463 RepID=A0A9X1VH44_9BACT|nr:polysaccharide deacetylase family protein [Hymenobacter cyanobacteriorum]MCI1186386.1 polysaccharide deacetylase family protein [Hymenobacter cyanobacteriorum]
MLTYRRALLMLAAGVALVLALWWWADASLAWLAVPVAAYVAAAAYGSSRISSSFFVETMWRGPTDHPHIALTFDDGPVPGTAQVLEILARHAAPATFFCIGQRARQQPEMLRQIDAAGHLIGNHTFTHSYFIDLFSPRRLRAEIAETDAAIAAATGRRPRLFRPPYGVTTPNFGRAIRASGHQCIGWSVRSLDTVAKDEAQLLNKVTAALAPGAVFLFHDTSAATAAVLDEFLRRARERGFRVVPLDQLLGVTPYA